MVQVTRDGAFVDEVVSVAIEVIIITMVIEVVDGEAVVDIEVVVDIMGVEVETAELEEVKPG